MGQKSPYLIAALFASVSLQALPAQAQPSSSTNYIYYSVSGQSLDEIYGSMVRKGPSSNGIKGFAVTTASPGKKMSVASCKKTGSYNFDVKFVIHLPRPANLARLAESEARSLKQFIGFVKGHEEQHRSIWMSSVSKYDNLLAKSGLRDCTALHNKAMALWSQMVKDSQPRQDAFDRSERRRLESQLFIRLAKG